MELALKLVTVCALATFCGAQLNYNNPVYIPEYIQTQSSVVEEIQEPPSYQEQPNINIQQLPNPNPPRPFFTSEPQPSTVLKAPNEDAIVTNFNLQNGPPVPSQDLQLPALAEWNPYNDPNLYYPIVVDRIVPLEIPTGLYPKKYNKNNEKQKSPILKLKNLVDDSVKQDPLKTLYNIAKKDNKNLLKLEKQENLDIRTAPSTVFETQKVNDPEPAESVFGFSSSHGANSNSLGFSHAPFSQGSGGDRMEFHVHGHDGPKSYKWGYDTGKGHNRHFRYEERDKHGYVKGHYGYYNKHGKLRMVHYDSDPHEGFHASEGDVGSY